MFSLIVTLFFGSFAAVFFGWLATVAVYFLLRGKHAALQLVETTFRMKEGRLASRHFDERQANETAKKMGDSVGVLYYCGLVLWMIAGVILRAVGKGSET